MPRSPALGGRGRRTVSSQAMHDTRFYYFAFTYRYPYGGGGPGELRARVT
jgi:hypothetical protein